MDRRGYLLVGAAALCAGLTSGFKEFEPTGVVGGTRDAAGLLSLASLDDRERPYFDDDPTTVSGSGNQSVEFDSGGGFTIVLAEHDGEGLFSLTAAESGGSPAMILEWSGPETSVRGVPMAATEYTFDVAASGDWNLTVAQPRSPAGEVRLPPARAVGTGDAIVGPLDTTDGGLVSIDHEGDGSLTVTLFLEAGTGVFEPETLFEATGPLEDEAPTSVAGVAWIAIHTDGSWTLEVDVPG